MNIFDRIVYFLDHTEVSIVTLIAKIVPLVVPLIPAYVGYKHVTDKVSGLGFDPWAGWVYAIVIEGLGYAAIYKAVQFWEHNKRFTAEKNQAPLQAAVVIYIVYLVVTLTVNVVLDWQAGVVWFKVFALGLISLLSVPAGLLMSISAIHTERTAEREQANEQARARRAESRTNEQPNEQPNEQRPNERTRRTKTNERLMPLPTNEHKPNTEQSFGFQTNTGEKGARLFQYIDELQAAGEPVPGVNELSRRLRMSKSHISETLKRARE
jgi:putative Mn2+ efflux pump MntP